MIVLRAFFVAAVNPTRRFPALRGGWLVLRTEAAGAQYPSRLLVWLGPQPPKPLKVQHLQDLRIQWQRRLSHLPLKEDLIKHLTQPRQGAKRLEIGAAGLVLMGHEGAQRRTRPAPWSGLGGACPQGAAGPPANHYRARTNLPSTCSRSARLAGRDDPSRMDSMRSTRYLGTIPPATSSRGSRKPPASRFHWADS